ncbi:ABC transporter substrate-binding protein [Arthrobacter sp. CAU 1506]|uniref:ABC transporter substrate-binding protein n=1 Tax=Arthrobacter sp. CAU 1506 TaxID=2560052 RepID=UPI00145F1BBB|nr:ABC transporter substrate-binding protein [Arthrobacter sp. CAU 1506]
MQRRIFVAAAALAITSLVAGCATEATGTADGADGTTTVTVGLLPIVPTAGFRLGVEKGFFKDEGLDIKIAEAQSGAAVMASVVSGEYDVGFAAVVPQIQAVEQGLPIKVIGTASSVSNNAGLFVAPDSPIKSPADLKGARIGVVALKSIDEVTIRGAADHLGVDSSTFQFVSVPFPEMLPALEAGRVDAVELPEPFYTAALSKGHREIIQEPMGVFLGDGATNSSFFTSDSHIAKKKNVVDSFIRALERSNEYATKNPQEVAKTVSAYTSISSDTAEKMVPTVFGTTVTTESYEALGELMVRYGILSADPNLSNLIYEDASQGGS